MRLHLLGAAMLVVATAGPSCDSSKAPPYGAGDPATGTPPLSQKARLVDGVPTDVRAMALTFDTGVDAPPDAVEAALRALRQANTRATFSVTGLWGELQRDLLFSIAADGHQIINGTYDGASLAGAATATSARTSEERALALSRAEVTVYRYTSRSTRPYVRPPFGDVDDAVLIDAAANGYTYAVRWGIDVPAETPPDAIVPLVLPLAAPGVIVRLPLTTAVATALPAVIDGLHTAGYDLLTVDELLHP